MTLTTSSLALLAQDNGPSQWFDVLARYSDPVSIWTQSNVADWQCGSVHNLLELAAFNRVSAHCAVFRPSNEEAILGPNQHRPHLRLDKHTPAMTVVLSSWQLSIVTGSSSEPVVKTRQ